MPGKRRFGVSLSSDLADSITFLSEKLGVDRSRLIEEAVRSYLEDYGHLLFSHHCRGILIAKCRDWSRVRRIAEGYKGIVSNIVHAHLGGECYEAFFLEGDSSDISGLYARLVKAGCMTRYIPLPAQINRED